MFRPVEIKLLNMRKKVSKFDVNEPWIGLRTTVERRRSARESLTRPGRDINHNVKKYHLDLEMEEEEEEEIGAKKAKK